MDNSKKLEALGGGKLLPLIFRYAWPSVVTMTVHQLYNVVDRIYIGQGCGPDAIAGLALTFPFMGALGAIGVLIGMGCSTILSISLGAGKMHDAERVLGQCLAMKILFGLIFPPLLFFFGFKPLLALMAGDGATASTLAIAHQYLSITIFFNIFAHLGFGLSATMRAEGSPKQSMVCMIIGCATNIILDPLFIFDRIPLSFLGSGVAIRGMGLGVAGAAWATNIAMIVTCAFTGEAAFGGAVGSGIALALQYGFKRGLFSNESGLGSAPLV
ncbi:MAG: alanine:cation symporter family protein, partial [Kiritimatiellae bacterium]|nr:alanine:cation symporter family protein [Kiritimatiellia bacterium]